jgi:hypothetical protein
VVKTTCSRRPSGCHCRFASAAPAHHDQLVRAETDVAMALELLELATTWEELDYSTEAVIPPADWLAFAAEHTWHDPEVAERLFSVAVDVARRGAPAPAGVGLDMARPDLERPDLERPCLERLAR